MVASRSNSLALAESGSSPTWGERARRQRSAATASRASSAAGAGAGKEGGRGRGSSRGFSSQGRDMQEAWQHGC